MTRFFARLSMMFAAVLTGTTLLVGIDRGAPQDALALENDRGLALVDLSRRTTVSLEPRARTFRSFWSGQRVVYMFRGFTDNLYEQVPGGRPQVLGSVLGHGDFLDATRNGDWVAYSKEPGGLFVAGPNRDLTRITEAVINNARLSPDGAYIAYHVLDAGSSWRLNIAQTDGQPVTNFLLPGLIERMAWSEHGLAFTVWDTNNLRVGVLRNGDDTPVYVPDAGSAPLMAWHPDGTTLALVIFDDAPRPALYALSLTDPTPQLVTNMPSNPVQLAWSPDGTQLASILYWPPDAHYHLYVLGEDGIPRSLYRAQNTGDAGTPLWSSDSRRVYIVDHTPDKRGFLVSVDVTSGRVAHPLAQAAAVTAVYDWWTPGGY